MSDLLLMGNKIYIFAENKTYKYEFDYKKALCR